MQKITISTIMIQAIKFKLLVLNKGELNDSDFELIESLAFQSVFEASIPNVMNEKMSEVRGLIVDSSKDLLPILSVVYLIKKIFS